MLYNVRCFLSNIPLPCQGALLVGMCSLPTEDRGMVGWVEGVEKATRQALSHPGIRTYGIPIDQHINQITKQRNAQDYIGRSEALSVGRIMCWEAEGKTCEITTLFEVVGGVCLQALDSSRSTTFHKGWNHLHTGLGEPLRICLNNHGPSPDVT